MRLPILSPEELGTAFPLRLPRPVQDSVLHYGEHAQSQAGRLGRGAASWKSAPGTAPRDRDHGERIMAFPIRPNSPPRRSVISLSSVAAAALAKELPL